MADTVPPVVPGSITATLGKNNWVTITTTAATGGYGDGSYSYTVHRSTTPNFTPSKKTILGMANGTTFIDQNAKADTTYYYTVETDSMDDDGDNVVTSYGSQVETKTNPAMAVGDLSYVFNSSTSVTLDLTAPASGGTGTGYSYQLTTYKGGTAQTPVGPSQPITAFPYRIDNLTPGNTLSYMVTATDSFGSPAQTQLQKVTPMALASGTLSATLDQHGQPVIASTAATGGGGTITTALYRGTEDGFTPSADTLLADNATFPYTDNSIDEPGVYYYVAITSDTGGDVAKSAQLDVTSEGRIEEPAAAKVAFEVEAAEIHGAVGSAIPDLDFVQVGASGDVSVTLLHSPLRGVSMTDGKFVGNPIAEYSGTLEFRATDSTGAFVDFVAPCTIAPALSMTVPETKIVHVNEDFSIAVEAAGGIGLKNFRLGNPTTSGNTKVGELTIDRYLGTIRGRVTGVGSVVVDVTVSDDAGAEITDDLEIVSRVPVEIVGMPGAGLVGIGSKVSDLLTAFSTARSGATPELITSAANYVLAVKYLISDPSSAAMQSFWSLYVHSGNSDWMKDTQFMNGFDSQSVADAQMAKAVHDAFMAIYVTGGMAAHQVDYNDLLIKTASQDLVHYLQRSAQSV